MIRVYYNTHTTIIIIIIIIIIVTMYRIVDRSITRDIIIMLSYCRTIAAVALVVQLCR